MSSVVSTSESKSGGWTFTRATQLLANINVCNKDVIQDILHFLNDNVKDAIKYELKPKADPSKKTESSALPKSFTVNGKTFKNELSKVDLEVVAELSNLLNIDTNDILKFVNNTSYKLIKTEESHNGFRLIELSGPSYFDTNEKDQLLKFYSSQFISEQGSIYKMFAQALKELPKAIHHRYEESLLDENDTKTLESHIEEINKSVPSIIQLSMKNIKFINKRINSLKDDDSELATLIKTEFTKLILEILNSIATTIIYSSNGFYVSSIVEWFSLMEATEYFSAIVDDCQQLLTIQSLSTIIALLFFDLEFNYGSLEDYSFMNSAKDLNTITKSILNTESNPIILYAWSIILHRKQTVLEIFSDDPKASKFLDELKDGPLKNIQDIYTSLAIDADKHNVSGALIQCKEAISYNSAYSNVLGTFVITYIPYIQPAENIIDTVSIILKSSSNKTIEKFFASEAVEKLMVLLKAKMPLSLDTFISLISINANLAVEELRDLSSYMHIADKKTFNLKYSIDDHQPELINLTSDYAISPPYETEGELCLMLKEGTKGYLLSGAGLENESLVAFLYKYNGWTLLGRVLRNLSINLVENDSKFLTISRVIDLLTVIVNNSDPETVNNVFRDMNQYYEDQDLTDVTLRILEKSLILKEVNTVADILKFLTALTNNGYDYRVWSYLFRSKLLSFKQNSGLISDILGKAEIPSGSYSSTIALFELGLALLSDSLKIDKNVTIKLKSQVLYQITSYGIRVFEHLVSWKFLKQHEKFKLSYLIATFFNKILVISNGIQDVEYKGSKVNEVLKESFDNLVNVFLIHDIEDLRSVFFVLQTLYSSSTSFTSIVTDDLTGNWTRKWQLISIELLSNLIKVRTSIAPYSPSTLEKTLYTSVKGLVNIYLFDESLKKPILKFMKHLVSAKWNGIPPSLLTHLGPTHTQLLLQALHHDMSNNSSDDELLIGLYDLFSATMKNNQDGLSVVLITGKVTITGVENILKDEQYKYSLFEVLKSALQNYEKYPAMVLIHILDALSCLLTTWNGGLIKSEDTRFINKVLTLALDTNIKTEGCNSIETIYHYKLKSKIVEILSLSLSVYHDKNKKCEDLIISKLNDKEFIEKLPKVFEVEQYDQAFQLDIKSKFLTKWEDKYSLDQFIIKDVHRPNDFNVDLVYDFELLDHIFGFDEDWTQMKRDIVKSGMNVLLNTVQIDFANSYLGLITCFCNTNCLNVNSQYLKVACELLTFSIDETFDQSSVAFLQDRIDLSFLICFTVSKKKESKLDDQILLSIITASSRLLESDKINLIHELTTINISYSKSLLKILLLSIRMFNNDDLLIENSSTFINIWRNVICKSINILFGSIRNKAIAIPNHEYGGDLLINKQINDVKLIFQLVEKFISLNFNGTINQELAKITIDSGAYGSIMNIYGVSHLIKVHGDDIFADLALLYILELIKNKYIAERFISNGTFQLLNESTMSLMIQRGHITPYSNDSTVTRLHQLWVERVLPIMLTLISHFQDSVTFELCRFTLAFQKQIEYTIHTWLEADSYISPIVIEETEQIIILAKVVNALDCYNYISLEMNKSLEEVKLIPGLDTIEERSTFVNVLNYLLSHPKYLGSKIRTLNREVSFDEITNSLVELKESLFE